MKKTVGWIFIIIGVLIYLSLYMLVALIQDTNKYILIFTLGYISLIIIPIGLYLIKKK